MSKEGTNDSRSLVSLGNYKEERLINIKASQKKVSSFDC